MNLLWDNPGLESGFLYLGTVFSIPVFYYLIWNDRFSPQFWKRLAGVGIFFYFALLVWFYNANPNASHLLAPNHFGHNTFSAAYLICEHLRIWIWPFSAEAVLRPINSLLLFKTNLLYWMVLLLILRHSFRLRKKNVFAWYGILWTVIGLIPVSQLWPYPGQPIAEKHLFIPSLGLCLALASLIKLTIQAWRKQFKHMHRKVLMLTFNVLSISMSTMIAVSFLSKAFAAQDLEYRIRQTIAHDTSNFAAVAELARIEARSGNIETAEQLIIRAGEVAPWYAETQIIKAEISYLKNDFSTALYYLESAQRLAPESKRIQGLIKLINKHTAASLQIEE